MCGLIGRQFGQPLGFGLNAGDSRSLRGREGGFFLALGGLLGLPLRFDFGLFARELRRLSNRLPLGLQRCLVRRRRHGFSLEPRFFHGGRLGACRLLLSLNPRGFGGGPLLSLLREAKLLGFDARGLLLGLAHDHHLGFGVSFRFRLDLLLRCLRLGRGRSLGVGLSLARSCHRLAQSFLLLLLEERLFVAPRRRCRCRRRRALLHLLLLHRRDRRRSPRHLLIVHPGCTVVGAGIGARIGTAVGAGIGPKEQNRERRR